jgi:NAD(P)-dependent dehydrogenase (short-subunit alcohol dehydrogenase family)/quinol monooxygenase YgiN
MWIEIIRLKPKPGAAPELGSLIDAARRGVLSPPACVSVDLLVGSGGDELLSTVRWASSEAHAQRTGTPEAKAFFQQIAALVREAPVIETFRVGAPTGALAGQVALVTGGGSGIGRAVVDRFVAEGANVVVVDRDAARLAAVVASHGDAVVTVAADIATVAGNEAAVRAALDGFGRIDTLVLNAGIFDGFVDFATLTPDDVSRRYEAIFDVNVRGPMLGASAALPHLVASSGSIIFTVSTASFRPDGGGVFYVASKHADLGMVRQLAHEFAPRVRVNAVAPGATRTPIGIPDVFGIQLDQASAEVSDMIASGLPIGRHAEPEDIAGAYVLLASRSDGRNMTGTIIECDGGIAVRGIRRVRGGDSLVAATDKAI